MLLKNQVIKWGNGREKSQFNVEGEQVFLPTNSSFRVGMMKPCPPYVVFFKQTS
jgi:hypothetical protein